MAKRHLPDSRVRGDLTLSWDACRVSRGRLAERFDLVVNASSVGLHERRSLRPFRRSAIPGVAMRVFDTVYRADPASQRHSLAASRAGGRAQEAVGGLALLLHQGALSFEHWFGGPVPLEAMRRGRWRRR